MFAQGCACMCLYKEESWQKRARRPVCLRERRRHISRKNLSSVFNKVFEHSCSNSDMIDAAYVHSTAH